METNVISMTYGVLPTREQFDNAFERECPDGYRIQFNTSDSRACDGYRLGDGTWTADQLWNAITEIVNDNEGDPITVSEDEEYEHVYQVFYPGTDRPYVEIGPDSSELMTWADKFAGYAPSLAESQAIIALNYASAYGSTGRCFLRHDAAMDIVSSIMITLGFEWI